MTLTCRPGATALMPAVQGLLGPLDEQPGLLVDLADEERRVRVAVHAAEIRGDVDVDDVAVLSRTVESGMPWQITSFTEVHSDLGNPR